ncbi:MAG: type II toxin-antitoxin system HicB family antitoxin [Caldilineaceae bacterium]|nr:type II toxin-antitoxin system HicB family antitoxin [Caldilineaceae bacterium]HRJ40780.1 type II toxin-antitoxin system HicB family antitoxin [Caldilineaceae bacterium]
MARTPAPLQALGYRIQLQSEVEPEGGYTVTVPSLPGCVTFGATPEEAVAMAKEAVALYLESLEAHNQPIPAKDGISEHYLRAQEALSSVKGNLSDLILEMREDRI